MTYPYNAIPTNNPQNFALPTPVGLQSANRNPTAQDNTFVPGSEWLNTGTGMFFKCISSTIAGAVWTPFIPSAAGSVSTLTGNSGGAVGPNGGGNINVVGDGTTINIVGNPGTNTLTASLVGGGVGVQSFVTNVASPVDPTGAGVVDVNASTSTYTDGTVANTLKIELQGTNHALFVGRGVHTPATTIATGTSGLPLVSQGAGGDPTFTQILSSVVEGITVTPTAGFIGEFITSYNGGGQALSSTVAQNITSIALTAGVWNVSGIGYFVFSIGGTSSLISIGTTSGTLTGSGGQLLANTLLTSGSLIVDTQVIPPLQVVIAAPATYYLVAQAIFGSGTCTGYGTISATRVA